MALRGICFGPGLASDWFGGFQIVLWFETGLDWFLVGQVSPRTKLNRSRTKKQTETKRKQSETKPGPKQTPRKANTCHTPTDTYTNAHGTRPAKRSSKLGRLTQCVCVCAAACCPEPFLPCSIPNLQPAVIPPSYWRRLTWSEITG